jgi:hypothetical protein
MSTSLYATKAMQASIECYRENTRFLEMACLQPRNASRRMHFSKMRWRQPMLQLAARFT